MELGTLPMKELFSKLKSISFNMAPNEEGRLPDKVLLLTKSPSSCDKLPISDGSEPCRELPPRCKYVNSVSNPMDVGIVPVIRLMGSTSSVSCVCNPILLVIVPENELFLKSTTFKRDAIAPSKNASKLPES